MSDFKALGLRRACWLCGTPTWPYDSQEWLDHIESGEHLANILMLGLTADTPARWES